MPRVVRLLACSLGAAVLLAACSRPSALGTYASEKRKFSIAYPAGWEIVTVGDDTRVWFLPTSAGKTPDRSTEFVLVLTEAQAGPLSDDEARQIGLNLLPIHGVSGFRRFKEEEGAVWHRFEVTGTSRGVEWASVGLLVTGAGAFQYVVCAKPLQRWREGQKQCDEILRTFRPGPLSPR